MCGKDFISSYRMRISLPGNMPAGFITIKDGESIKETIGKQPGGD